MLVICLNTVQYLSVRQYNMLRHQPWGGSRGASHVPEEASSHWLNRKYVFLRLQVHFVHLLIHHSYSRLHTTILTIWILQPWDVALYTQNCDQLILLVWTDVSNLSWTAFTLSSIKHNTPLIISIIPIASYLGYMYFWGNFGLCPKVFQ